MRDKNPALVLVIDEDPFALNEAGAANISKF